MRLIRKLKYPLTIVIVLGIIIYCIVIKNKLNKNDIEINNETNSLEKIPTEIKEIKPKEFKVDIKGAIKNPGVYIVNENNTVIDVITKAGGLTANADTSLTNLSKKVSEEMVIIIYTKEEVKNSNIVDTVIKVVEKECVCPNIQNDSCINEEIESTISNNETKGENKININTATLEELQTIPGIGESKAKSIIEYRDKTSNFVNIEDILNVSGIGQKLYEEIKIHITT